MAITRTGDVQMQRSRLSTPWLLLAALLAAAPAWADVELRVEGQPISDPIQAFITVTDSNGDPVPGLTAANFTVTLDGQPVIIQPADLTLPPSQDPNQKVSVIFAMDFSFSVTTVARAALEDAVIAFIDAMNDGDFAAIVKFNGTLGASVVQPFVAIDHGANSAALETVVMADYPGSGTNIYDALLLAIEHFVTPPSPLPPGPKAVILVSDGEQTTSAATQSGVIALANDNSIPLFTVGVGSFSGPRSLEILTRLADETGGSFLPAPTDADIAASYAQLSQLLNNEYLLTIASGITDCADHTLVVAIAGQAAPANATFTRRACDLTPNPFTFTSQTGVATNSQVTSNAVTITGIEADAPIDSENGRYSVGCTGTFTGTAGTISNGQTVCVRHDTSTAFSTSTVSTLTVGDVSATFTSTTLAEPTSGGGGGGGGATGALELLIGLCLLRRRRKAKTDLAGI